MTTTNKNIKDVSNEFGIVIKDTEIFISYKKTNKLITALYMVTDIIDKDEPLRKKLRMLGTEIISDMYSNPALAEGKISETMSFLSIASAIGIVSEMNANILRKEFVLLEQSIKDASEPTKVLNTQVDLSEFFQEDITPARPSVSKVQYKSIGHQNSTRIGVQKGSTLLQVLSDKTRLMSDKNEHENVQERRKDFEMLKLQRRADIVNVIRQIGVGATITDINTKAKTIPDQVSLLLSTSEKTLQRELVSMIADGVLNKTGEKRWSKYFLIQP